MGNKSLLFFGEAAALYHVVRPLVLAEALDANKYKVYFACNARTHDLFKRSTNIEFLNISSVESEAFAKAATYGDFSPNEGELFECLKEDLDIVDTVRPSLIISDLRFTASIAAELRRIPHIAVANVYWSPFRDLDFDPRPPNLSLASPSRTKSATQMLNTLRGQFGLPSLQGFCEVVTRGDFTLYSEPPGFIKLRKYPRNHVFLGPVLWSPAVPPPNWWHTWNSGLPLIYLTLGSTGPVSVVRDILPGLQALGVNVLVATAGRFEIKSSRCNTYLAKYLPGTDVCRLADAIICNGGSTTAYQALTCGKPVIGLWANIDQYLSAMSIANTGAGMCARAADVDSRRIGSMVSAVLRDRRYATCAKRLASLMNRYDAPTRFRQVIERVID